MMRGHTSLDQGNNKQVATPTIKESKGAPHLVRVSFNGLTFGLFWS